MSRFLGSILIIICLGLLFYGGLVIKEKNDQPNNNLYVYFYYHDKFYPAKRNVSGLANRLDYILTELWKGPNASEKQRGIITLLPADLILLDHTLSNGTLCLTFNDKLLKIAGGNAIVEGLLKQIVFTCTQFLNVQDVKFKVAGYQNNTLIIGGDGYTISAPLNREYFKEE